MVLHVEDARGVVGALEEGAEAREIERLAAHDGAVGDAAEEVRALLHPVEEPVAPAPAMRLRSSARTSSQVAFSVSHISEVICQRTACAFSRAQSQAARSTEGLFAVEREEVDQRAASDELLVALEERLRRCR